LQREVSEWRLKHIEAIETAKATEKHHLSIIKELEAAKKSLQEEHASRTSQLEQSNADSARTELEKAQHEELVAALQSQLDEHKATAAHNAARLAELEQSHASILSQVEADAEARALTEKELDTHRSLVFNLEKQIEEHKAAIDVHQQGLESLKQSHAAELEKISDQLAEQQNSSQALQAQLHQAKLEVEVLLRDVAAVLNEETDMTKLHAQIETLVADRKSLLAQFEEANNELSSARKELTSALDRVTLLEGTVTELEALNKETIKELEKVSDKEQKSSRLVQELEDQLNQNWDQHEAANNRLSALQTERSRELQEAVQRKDELEREVEESRGKIALLEVCQGLATGRGITNIVLVSACRRQTIFQPGISRSTGESASIKFK